MFKIYGRSKLDNRFILENERVYFPITKMTGCNSVHKILISQSNTIKQKSWPCAKDTRMIIL